MKGLTGKGLTASSFRRIADLMDVFTPSPQEAELGSGLSTSDPSFIVDQLGDDPEVSTLLGDLDSLGVSLTEALGNALIRLNDEYDLAGMGVDVGASLEEMGANLEMSDFGYHLLKDSIKWK